MTLYIHVVDVPREGNLVLGTGPRDPSSQVTSGWYVARGKFLRSIPISDLLPLSDFGLEVAGLHELPGPPPRLQVILNHLWRTAEEYRQFTEEHPGAQRWQGRFVLDVHPEAEDAVREELT